MNKIIIFVLLIILIALIAFYWYSKNSKKIIKNRDVAKKIPKNMYKNLDHPEIYHIENLLTRNQRLKLIEIASNKLGNSQLVGGTYNNMIRNSKQSWIKKNDPLIKDIYKELAKLLNTSVENAEDMQIVRYLPGEYFKAHNDACCDDNEICKKFIKNGGQRKYTVLVYLNDEFTDGETYFRNLDLKIKPKPGDAIVFSSIYPDTSKCDPKSIHEGLPVTTGTKWIANIWFRESKYSA